MIHLQRGARRWRQAFFPGAEPLCFLLPAGGLAEVCRRPAYIVYVSLEIRQRRQQFCLAQHALLGARRDHAPLVERDGAEVAPAETAAVVHKRKLHFLDGRHTALGRIAGMPGAHIGKLIHSVELRAVKRESRRVLHQKQLSVLLQQPFAAHGVLFILLFPAGDGVLPLGSAHLLIARAIHGRAGLILRGGDEITGAANVAQRGNRLPRCQPIGDLHRLALSHAEGEKIRTGFQQDGGADGVVPVIIMGEAPQGSFQPADDDGALRIQLTDLLRIDDGGAIRAKPRFIAGGIRIRAAPAAGGGIMRHHTVNVARAHHEPEARLPETDEIFIGPPVRLSEHRHTVSMAFQHTGDDGRAEGGVIDVGIPGDQNEVRAIPAQRLRLFFCDRQKRHLSLPLSIRSPFPFPIGTGRARPKARAAP